MATGVTTVDFGVSESYASVTVTGLTGLSAGSYMEAFKMAEASADNTADEHVIAPIEFTCEYVSATDMLIHALSDWDLSGVYNLRFVTA